MKFNLKFLFVVVFVAAVLTNIRIVYNDYYSTGGRVRNNVRTCQQILDVTRVDEAATKTNEIQP